jgi:hypothetical protein
MLKRSLLVVALACLLALAVTFPGGADVSAPLSGQWNRLSVDRSHPAPEHELLSCAQNSRAQAGTSSNTWFCHYSKRPEPTLNFFWNNNQGFFSGQDVTATWSCPAWFPTGICPNVVQVVVRRPRRDPTVILTSRFSTRPRGGSSNGGCAVQTARRKAQERPGARPRPVAQSISEVATVTNANAEDAHRGRCSRYRAPAV